MMIASVNSTVSHPTPIWQSGAQSKMAEQDKPILQDSTFRALEGAAAPVKQQLYFKEGDIQSPFTRAISASAYDADVAQQLLTYNASGRFNESSQTVYSTPSTRASVSQSSTRLSSQVISSNDTEPSSTLPSSKGNQTDGSSSEETIKNKKEQQSEEQVQEEVRNLASRDREVRNHEQAHAAVGGAFAGAPSFELQRGPDGVSYAVGGEVAIDIGKGRTPEETIAKAQTVRRAALAPAEPSPQDRSVAQQAARLESEARRDLLRENSEASDDILSAERVAVGAQKVATEADKFDRSSESIIKY